MSELIPFLCLKLYSLNFAIAHGQKRLIGLSEFVILVLRTVLPLETSSEINFEFIKCVKKCKMSPFDKKKNREY